MQPYIGEIRMFAGNFGPAGWMLCQGQVLPISEYEALYNLIGTTYGGDGQSTFALPNLQSRVPMHVGPGYSLGQPGGSETVTLVTAEIPSHSHPAVASSVSAGTQPGALNASWAANATVKPFAPGPSVNANMAATNVGFSGGNQPHDNMLPFLVINFIISLFGVFPSQT